MEGRDQRTRGPTALTAPRRVQHDVVDAGAQRVMRRPQLLVRHAAVARGGLELAHLAHRALAQIVDIGRRQCGAQPPEQLQQGRGGDDQRIEAELDRFGTQPAHRRGSIADAVARCVAARGGRRCRQAVTTGAPGAARRPPGAGRMTVRSESSGSAKGSSLIRGSPIVQAEGWEIHQLREWRSHPSSASAPSAGCRGRVRNTWRRRRTAIAAARPAAAGPRCPAARH